MKMRYCGVEESREVLGEVEYRQMNTWIAGGMNSSLMHSH